MILCKRESRNTILIMEMTGNGEQQCTWGRGKKALKRTRPKHPLKGHGNLVGLVLDASTFLWGHSSPAASDTKWGGWPLALVHTDSLGTVFPLQPKDIRETQLHSLSVKTMAHWLLCWTSSGRVELVHIKTLCLVGVEDVVTRWHMWFH